MTQRVKRRYISKAERAKNAANFNTIKWIRLKNGGISGYRGRFWILRRHATAWELTDRVSLAVLGVYERQSLAKQAAEVELARIREAAPYAAYWRDLAMQPKKKLPKGFPCLSGHRHRTWADCYKCEKKLSRKMCVSHT